MNRNSSTGAYKSLELTDGEVASFVGVFIYRDGYDPIKNSNMLESLVSGNQTIMQALMDHHNIPIKLTASVCQKISIQARRILEFNKEYYS